MKMCCGAVAAIFGRAVLVGTANCMPPAAQDARHTLLLVQYNNSHGSRTFLDFESQSAAMDGICGLYERELKALNPGQKNITYDVADLYTYLDQLTDISCLMCVQHTSLHIHRICEIRVRFRV